MEKGLDKDESKQIGLIAQEVEMILPDLVDTDDKGFKSVEYSKLVSVLIEAIKSQQLMIDELKAQNHALNSNQEKIFTELDIINKTLNQQTEK